MPIAFDLTNEERVRSFAFEWLKRQVEMLGEVLPRDLLAQGPDYRNTRIPLLGPQGIFKPRVLDLPLSITTVFDGPYDDRVDADGAMSYRYRGTDPQHRDNVGLRQCMTHRIPLAYFFGVAPGRYMATWPVFVVTDAPDLLTFGIEVDDPQYAFLGVRGVHEAEEGRRRYVTAIARRRLHQQSFRERVLAAYRDTCAVCCLRHRVLLESAHIIPDSEPQGDPIVPNGLALCRLHHAAYDKHLIGIRPDYVVEVRSDVLLEVDGPMLVHGLQQAHEVVLQLPRSPDLRPDPERLAWRYERFLGAA